MSTADTLTSREWCYYIEGENLFLFEIDDTNNVVPPTGDVDNGLLIRYKGDSGCFVNSDGLSEDGSPDEDSILNFSAGYIEALEAFLKSCMAEREKDFRTRDYWMRECNRLLNSAQDAMTPGVKISTPVSPFAIR